MENYFVPRQKFLEENKILKSKELDIIIVMSCHPVLRGTMAALAKQDNSSPRQACAKKVNLPLLTLKKVPGKIEITLNQEY